MPIAQRPSSTLFSSGSRDGETVTFPDWARGWGLTFDPGQSGGVPPMEYFNGSFKQLNEGILYAVQNGICPWSEDFDYQTNGYVSYNGTIWQANANSKAVTPGTNNQVWKLYHTEPKANAAAGFKSAALLEAGIEDNGLTDTTDSSQTLDAIKTIIAPSVDSYQELRSYTGNATQLTVKGRVTPTDGGYGIFLLDSTDTTSIDNDGTTIVSLSGKRWKRTIWSLINIKWFGEAGGPNNDASTAVRKAINAYPNSDICIPWDSNGYYFDSTVEEPNSASYRLIGTGGIQSSLQQLMYARLSGPVFHCQVGNTTFTSYEGFRFVSNKVAYPLAKAVYNQGDYIHGKLKEITVQNFKLPPLHFLGATNAASFEKILVMNNDSYGLKVEQGSANRFISINGDNNDGPILWANGGANYFSGLYSEDCCKRNVTDNEANPEFYIIGDAPVIDGIILNSFAGNTTPPIKLDLCRQVTITGGINKSTTTPSYPYEIQLPSQDTSITSIGATNLRTGGYTANIIKIDPGYANIRPSIKVGKFERDLCILAPIARVSFNGTGDTTIHQGAGIASVAKVGPGVYQISFVEPIAYISGLTVIGMADNNNNVVNATVCEMLGSRTENSVNVRVQIAGTNVDCQFISIVIFGTPT